MLIFSFLILIAADRPLAGEDWPQWRGPRGDGISMDRSPTRWDGTTGENIAWKSRVAGVGHASPIVFGDYVFVVSCSVDSQERLLTCLNRDTGKVIWQRSVLTAPLESIHRLNSYASSTPATDGAHVYVSFLKVGEKLIDAPNVGGARKIKPGIMVLACYDMRGNKVWQKSPGGFISAHGYCSSPILYEDLLIVNGDHDGDSYIVALDKESGDEVWRRPRLHRTRSYVTPLIRTIDGREQMVLSGSKRVVSLDPRSGELHWLIEGPTEQFVASMVFDGEKFFLSAGFPTHHVMAIDPSGKGDVTKTKVAWHSTKAKCYVPSPVVIGKHLLVADDRGTANCFHTSDGRQLWKERLSKHYSASLVAARGLAYFVSDDGVTKIVKPGPKLEIVAENPLGEFAYASPALSEGQLYIRGERHLFCIGKRNKPAGAP